MARGRPRCLSRTAHDFKYSWVEEGRGGSKHCRRSSLSCSPPHAHAHMRTHLGSSFSGGGGAGAHGSLRGRPTRRCGWGGGLTAVTASATAGAPPAAGSAWQWWHPSTGPSIGLALSRLTPRRFNTTLCSRLCCPGVGQACLNLYMPKRLRWRKQGEVEAHKVSQQARCRSRMAWNHALT